VESGIWILKKILEVATGQLELQELGIG